MRSANARMRALVAAATSARSRSALDTVMMETPAASAISLSRTMVLRADMGR